MRWIDVSPGGVGSGKTKHKRGNVVFSANGGADHKILMDLTQTRRCKQLQIGKSDTTT